MAKEVESIKKVLENGEHPVTAILGGSKVSSKLPIIYKMLESVDNLIIGGGMAYTFIKAMGGKIGDSLQEPEYMQTSLEILEKAKQRGVNVYLTKDAVTTQEFSDKVPVKVFPANAIEDGWGAMDIASETEKYFSEVVKNSKTILWNGPMGVFEMDKFAKWHDSYCRSDRGSYQERFVLARWRRRFCGCRKKIRFRRQGFLRFDRRRRNARITRRQDIARYSSYN